MARRLDNIARFDWYRSIVDTASPDRALLVAALGLADPPDSNIERDGAVSFSKTRRGGGAAGVSGSQNQANFEFLSSSHGKASRWRKDRSRN